MRQVARAAIIGLLLSGLLLLAGAVAQQPVTQADCPDQPAVHAFKEWPTGLENLAFAGGAVYVSDVGAESLLRIDPDRRVEIVATFTDLHGVVADANGVVYFTARDGDDVPWQVWRLDGNDTEPASGPTLGWNGMAITDEGDLYITDLYGEGIYRIPADDPSRSDLWYRAEGVNGLSYDPSERILYAAVMLDQRSPILRIPLDLPATATEIHLSFGAVSGYPPTTPRPPSDATHPAAPKILDDLTLGPDGMLYVAAHGAGELLRVDPATGDACVLAKGLKEPTSVRVASGFPPYDGDLFVTTFGGDFVASQVGRTPLPEEMPDRPQMPREPALLRIATGFQMPDATSETGATTPPTEARETPGVSIGALFALLAGARFARSAARSRP